MLSLKANVAEYPQTKALLDGRVTSDVVKLDFCGPEKAHNGFKDMLRRGAYDCGELAIVTYLQAVTYGKPWVALPAPVSGRFQHHCAGFNRELGHVAPKDIEGQKVGVRTYAQTTGLWVRGVLQHEHGVDLDKVTFMTVGEGHLEEYSDPPNCVRLPKGSDIGQMMLDGELAATLQGVDLPKDPRVERLVPDPFNAGKAWYAKSGIVPINHLFVVHADLARDRPDVVRELYRMIGQSRDLTEGGLPDPFPPMGFEANRTGIELAIQFAFEQRIIPRKMSIEELFDPAMRALN
ncbi:phosphate ABC transporter substrate-binding protein [Novosphingobium sp. AAP83]|uniref:phosphate ABC transporter substrate-binding protein n=1 Tax=Novosphingobium sp. AAP83 TaxID=1523425 RepID=UPI0006B8C90D|nr:phosphate ABC transporter substrate-binding protein [Novosphingobium sp. AAP83]KPF88584.1 phosphate ABC transporter substrate-binding protein [Novosphingobium sp. AAP83]